MTNKYVGGGIITDDDAAVIGPILVEIESKAGIIRAEDVVEAARPKTSPIHEYFEWDDDRAGELYRLQQAQWLIRSVLIRVEDVSSPVRAFPLITVSTDADTAHRGYMGVARAMSDVEYREQVLEAAKAEARRFAAKYRAFKELAAVIGAIESL